LSDKLDVGGQAVIEGVMMRGPKSMVIAVRKPDDTIVVKDSEWKPLNQRWNVLKKPFLRGAVVMVEALINGMQALSFSADVAIQAEEEAEAIEKAKAEGVTDLDSVRKAKEGTSAMTQGAIAFSLISSLFLGAGLFIYVPHVGASVVFGLFSGVPFAELLSYDPPVESPLFHTIVGAIKMTIFVCYILLIRRMPDIKRVFQYHGAEHKSIHVYEAGEELTVANAAKYPTFHPRCGTSFLVFVILISIGFFAAAFPIIQTYLIPETLTGWKLTLLQASIKLPMMIPIAGISFEVIKWAGRKKNEGAAGPGWDLLVVPGRLMQKLTTIEPDDKQLEVALVSLRRALEHEGALVDPDWSGVTFLAAAEG
jgi:uncharacterized protein YqhQ